MSQRFDIVQSDATIAVAVILVLCPSHSFLSKRKTKQLAPKGVFSDSLAREVKISGGYKMRRRRRSHHHHLLSSVTIPVLFLVAIWTIGIAFKLAPIGESNSVLFAAVVMLAETPFLFFPN